MRELILLLKVRFRMLFSLEKIKKMKKIKIVAFILLGIYVGLSFIFSLSILTNDSIDYLKKYNMASVIIPVFYVGISFLIFYFSIYNSKSSMFSSKDNDLVLSLPIKANVILASRVIYTIIWNLLFSIVLMGSVFVIYAMKVNVDTWYVLMAILTVLFLPIIPTIIASIFGYLIAYVSSRFNSKNWIEFIMSILIFIVIYAVMLNSGKVLNYIVLHFEEVKNVLKYGFYSVYLIFDIFSNNNYLLMIMSILLNIVLFALFIYALSLNFKNIIAKLQENRTRANYKITALKSKLISKTLFLKEAKKYFSTPVYVMNTSIGLVLMVGYALYTVFANQIEIKKAIESSGLGSNMFVSILVMIAFVVFMSNTTCASISLEGKSFWILKTLPIRVKDIFYNKIKFNVILVLIPTIISIIILTFTMNFTLIQFIILLVASIICSLASSQLGLLVNLKYPKLDATSDIVVVKRSFSVIISTMIPMIIIFSLAGLYAAISSFINLNIYLLIVFCLITIICVFEFYLLNNWAIERFKKIN